MSELNLSMPTIFFHEGRYVNDRSDPGGETNFGISLQFLLSTGDLDKDGWVDGDVNHDSKVNVEDIKNMTEDEATRLYALYFWNKYNYGNIQDQQIATKIFDLSINMGSMGAHKCAQRALRAASGLTLQEDGILGANTIKATNLANSVKLLSALKSEAAGYYRIIKYKGSKNFLKGWLNRAYSDAILPLV